MNYIKLFLGLILLMWGCQSLEEDDFDHMALAEEEYDLSRLSGEPTPSPQEILIKEMPLVE